VNEPLPPFEADTFSPALLIILSWSPPLIKRLFY